MTQKITALAPDGVFTLPENLGASFLADTAELRARLEEAEQILGAIRSGDVDAVVVQGPKGDQLFTLKGADEPYRVLIEEMNQGAVTLSETGAILYCNRRFASLVQRPLEEIVGVEFQLLVAPSDQQEFRAMLALGATDPNSGEISLQTSDGGFVTAELALSQLPPDSAASICLIATDISERKRVEAELKNSEAGLSEAQQSAHVGSWEVDIATNEISWSAELYRIYRLNRDHFVPSYEGVAELIHPDDRTRVLEEVTKARDEQGSFSHDHRIIRSDATAGVVQARGRMVSNERGEPVRFVGTCQDITDRKKAETDLEDANRQLRDASRQSGMAEVATSVLHNVGNVLNSVNVSSTVVAEKMRKFPIGSVSKIADLLRENSENLPGFFSDHEIGQKLPDFFATLAARLAEEQAMILDELQSLNQNIEHIKDIVLVQQSYANIAGIRETLPLAGCIEDALRITSPALLRHNIRIVREISDVPPVTLEKHKLLQILVNLIRNAKHALADSGDDNRVLTARLERIDDFAVISIQDNGCGIPVENTNRIFTHGFTTKPKGHGFGLHSGALAAHEMGGSLQAYSAGSGHGACFTLSLPYDSPS